MSMHCVRGTAAPGISRRSDRLVVSSRSGSSSRNLRPAQWQQQPAAHSPVSAPLQHALSPSPTAAAATGWSKAICRCSTPNAGEPVVPPVVVVEGDIVSFHMTCQDDNGKVLESSREAGEPLSFEIGAGDISGNPFFQAFDGALRGLGVGEAIQLEISGGDWKQELLFTVPRDHPEVERLEGRYKNQGGLQKDLAVELANGQMAVVVETTDEFVRLDANNIFSGKKLLFELEVLSIDRPPA